MEKLKEEMSKVEVTENEEEEPEDTDAADDDPFRPSWQKGQRNKIFTR